MTSVFPEREGHSRQSLHRPGRACPQTPTDGCRPARIV